MKTVMSLTAADQDRQVANVRMQLLLKDMQQLAQVGEHAPSTEIIDSHSLVQAALKEVAPSAGHDVDIDLLPKVESGCSLGLQRARLRLLFISY